MKPTTGVKALVLAAGYGARLRPLTDHTPKPALPVLGLPMLAHTLRRLAAVGVVDVAVNLHHLDAQIPERLAGVPGLPEVRYSFEESLLGTLGALAPLRGFFADARAVLIVNGDSLCRWPIRRLLRRHFRCGAAATLLLTTRAAPARYGGGVGIDRDRNVVSFRAGGSPDGATVRRVFAGAHALSPRLLERLPEGPSDSIADLYEPLLREGSKLATCATGRRWHDLGTPRRYLEGVVAAGRPWHRWPHRWVHEEARVAPGARLRGVVVEAGASVAAGARLDRCLLLPGARVEASCVLEDVIVGFAAEIPPRTRVAGRLVTRERSDATAPAHSSRLGQLWYTPLETPAAAGAVRRASR
jgi:mannose-1-phosphate guanylyltransferase